jgi:hypothetical protein
VAVASIAAQDAAEPQQTGKLAVVHLAPFAPDPGTAVTVTLDGNPLLTDFVFAESTGYIDAPVGTHLIEIFPAGSATPVITKNVTFNQDEFYTAVAIGGANGWAPELLVLNDEVSPPPSGSAKVRIGHLAPFAADLADTLADIRLQDGTVILDDVPYEAVAGYLPLAAGTYDLKITTADGATTLIDLMPVDLMDGDILSVFAVGDAGNQPVGAFALPSGVEGSLLPLAASLQVAHLAPFATDPDTSVRVDLDGTPILSNFEFADSTGYVPVEAGIDHLVEVFPTGSATPAITATVNLTQAMGYAAVAIGGANSWPLELLLLEDDATPPPAGSAKVRIGHLAPFAANVAGTLADVRLQDGTVILDDVPYEAVAGYLPLAAGTYDLKITTADGATTLIDPMPVDLMDGDILSVFAVGDAGNQPVGAFALPTGVAGGLLPLAASLQVAHLAPFAADPGTSVTVALDGTPILSNFEFADSTGYVPVEAGIDHLVEIIPTGSATPAITATVNLTHAMGYAAVAIGGASGWPLELLLLEDDATPPPSGSAKVRIGHLAPFAANVADTLADVRLQDGTVILDDVPYEAVAGYLPLPAGTYDLKITTADGSVTLIDPLPVTLNDGDNLSVFAIGDVTNQSVAAFALPLGEPGFILPEFAIYMPLIFKSSQ